MASKEDQLKLSQPVIAKRSSSILANLWRTALLMTSSAALGGIAVAIWNRRSLVRMRQQSDATPAKILRNTDDTLD